MSAIPRPVTASAYFDKPHPDSTFSSQRSAYSMLQQMPSLPLHEMASPLGSPLYPLSPVAPAFQSEYSVSSSYNSTESLVSVLGHQSYDSEQCRSPNAESLPQNNGGHAHKMYTPGYIQSPLANSSPFEKPITGDVDSKPLFDDNRNASSNRYADGVDGDPKDEHDEDDDDDAGDVMTKFVTEDSPRNRDEAGEHYYSNESDHESMLSVNASLPVLPITHKLHRSKKNRPRGELTSVRSEPSNVREAKSMQEQNLSELENLNPLQLTAWEQWMLRKAKLDREKRISDVRQVAKDKEDGVKVQHEKEEKDKRVQEQLSQWCLKKRMDNDLKKLKKRQHELEAEQQRRQKAEADQRADDNFRLWLSTKARLNRETKQRDKDRKEKLEKEQSKRHKVSQAEFDKWCTKVENRTTRQRHNSIDSGHSKSVPFAEPEPTFYNPIPWQPTVIPSAKADRKCRPCRSRYLSTTKCW